MKNTNLVESTSIQLLTSLNSKKKDKTDSKKKSKSQTNMPSNSKCIWKNPDSPLKKLSRASKLSEPWSHQSEKESLQLEKENHPTKENQPFQNPNLLYQKIDSQELKKKKLTPFRNQLLKNQSANLKLLKSQPQKPKYNKSLKCRNLPPRSLKRKLKKSPLKRLCNQKENLKLEKGHRNQKQSFPQPLRQNKWSELQAATKAQSAAARDWSRNLCKNLPPRSLSTMTAGQTTCNWSDSH